MAAFGTDTTKFSDMFNAALKARKDAGIVNLLNRPGLVAGGAKSGTQNVRITTAVTLQTPADGTMLANNAARTNVALTAFVGAHTLSLFGYELEQWDADADAAEVNAFIDAAILAAETAIITGLVGMTPTSTATLTAGQLNFSTHATDGEIRDNLGKLYTSLAGVISLTQGKPKQIVGITTPTAYANLWALADSAGAGGNIRVADDILYIKGYPVFMTSAAFTGFGTAAAADAFYWVHRDGYALCWSGAEIHTPLSPTSDGLYKKIWQSYGWQGEIQDSHIGVVVNGSA